MQNLRLIFAVAVCRLSRLALRLFNRGGTTLPGVLALKICPDVISKLSSGLEIVAVSGTNGKTTVTHMLEKAAKTAGGGYGCLQPFRREFSLGNSRRALL